MITFLYILKNIAHKKLIFCIMNLEELKEYVTVQFVEDFDNIRLFYNNINKTFEDAKLDVKYENYNIFCLDILANVEIFYNLQKEFKLYPKVMVDILNQMVLNKMREDADYESKLKKFKIKDKVLIK